MKLRRSLLVRYLTIVILALLMWPLMIPIATIAYNVPIWLWEREEDRSMYTSSRELERMWHREAKSLSGSSADAVDDKLNSLKNRYREASMFWVDGDGAMKLALPERTDLPAIWQASESIQFMKTSIGGDPFTVVAFIGGDPKQGFMVFQVPRRLIFNEAEQLNYNVVFALILLMFTLFIVFSWLFFYRIRRRLVRLQKAMDQPDDSGIPSTLEVRRQDEIGQLEQAFNRMIGALKSSRERELEEEHLRKQLIANLSHDLRTPLTTIRGHAHSLRQEPLTDKGLASLVLIESKTEYMGHLMENLLSYTLLSAGKYPLRLQAIDIVRALRSTAAAWYPVFEKEGLEVDVQLPDHAVYGTVDPSWWTRMIDNLLQNVVRHAKAGRYVSIRLEETGDKQNVLVIEDKGPGMKAHSEEQGAGIGLTIVSMMVKEMGLGWDIDSTPEGTKVKLMLNATKKLNES